MEREAPAVARAETVAPLAEPEVVLERVGRRAPAEMRARPGVAVVAVPLAVPREGPVAPRAVEAE